MLSLGRCLIDRGLGASTQTHVHDIFYYSVIYVKLIQYILFLNKAICVPDTLNLMQFPYQMLKTILKYILFCTPKKIDYPVNSSYNKL